MSARLSLEPSKPEISESHLSQSWQMGHKVNLFCSGHAFLPDGRLLVVGGHRRDSDGLNQATLYDWTTNTWTPTAPMTTPMRGRGAAVVPDRYDFT